MPINRYAYAVVFVALAGSPVAVASQTDITGTTGAISVVATPPTNISTGDWESNNVHLFAEQQDVVLSQPLYADITQPGTVDGGNPNLSSAYIPAGTDVDSYYLHFDPVGSTSRVTAAGTVTLDRTILGLMGIYYTIQPANPVVGLSGVVYDDGSLEFTQTPDGDSVTLDPDLKSISFVFNSSSGSDDLRIITLVPEPTTDLFSILGLIAPCFRRPRKPQRDLSMVC